MTKRSDPIEPIPVEKHPSPTPPPRYAENEVVVDPCGPAADGRTHTDDDDGAQRTRR